MPVAAVESPLSLGLVAVLNAMVLTVLAALAGLALGARLSSLARTRAERVVDGRWRPLLLEALVAAPPEVPPVDSRLGPVLLRAWWEVRNEVRGEAAARLDDLARRAGLDAVAARLLRRGRHAGRVLAIESAGHLRLASCWDDIVPALAEPGVGVNLAAARTLVAVDPDRALREVLPVVAGWEGVHPSMVASVLSGLAAAAAGAVLDLVRTDPEGPVAWRIRVFGHLRDVELLPGLLDMAGRSDDPEVLAATARVAGEAGIREARAFVRPLLDHPEPFVRLRAVSALGRVGTFGDDRRLLDAAADTNWWVRYRSAQALAALPFVTVGEIRWWAENHPDRFARDAIGLALREADWAAGPHPGAAPPAPPAPPARAA